MSEINFSILEKLDINQTILFPCQQLNDFKEEELNWLRLVEQKVLQYLGDFGFNLDRLSNEIHLSPRQIRRRLKQLIGIPFSQFVKTARMETAYQLLEKEKVTSIKQLAYKVGMRDHKYFSKQFKQHYGEYPSYFLDKI